MILVILLFEVETKTKILIKPVILLMVLISPRFKASILVFPPCKVRTKASDGGTEAETENSAKSGVDNIGFSVIRSDVTMSSGEKFSIGIGDVRFGRKFSAGVDNMGFGRKSSVKAGDMSFRILRAKSLSGHK